MSGPERRQAIYASLLSLWIKAFELSKTAWKLRRWSRVGSSGFKEICLCEDDTFGIKIALAEYQMTDNSVS